MALDQQPLVHFYGLCERTASGVLEEPLNVLSNAGFFLVAIAIFRYYRNHRDVKGKKIWDIHVLTALIVIIGISSTIFHSHPTNVTELVDIIPIVMFINLFFFSIIIRIERTTIFQTIICYLAFAGSTHILVTQFPEAMNDSIGYLSTMAALVMIAVHLHLKRRPSSHQFLLASLVGLISIFFRSVDNAVCEQIPFGTHFLWHSLNAILLYILMKQLIRNVNREARLARAARIGTHH